MSVKGVLIKFIKIYQRYISFVLRNFISGRCRFTPTCSEYSKAAVNKYGAIRGSLLSLKRILRCNPLFTSGHDPVK